jgi:hypothetical protein
MTKSTITKVVDTWSFFCGACWKYGMGYKSREICAHALKQHWTYFKNNPGKYSRHE